MTYIKCPSCGEFMVSTSYNQYYCPLCNLYADDLVYRPLEKSFKTKVSLIDGHIEVDKQDYSEMQLETIFKRIGVEEIGNSYVLNEKELDSLKKEINQIFIENNIEKYSIKLSEPLRCIKHSKGEIKIVSIIITWLYQDKIKTFNKNIVLV